MLYMATRGGGAPVLRADFTPDTLQMRRVSYWPVVAWNVTPWCDQRPEVPLAVRRMNPDQVQLAYDTIGLRFVYQTPGTIYGDEHALSLRHQLRDTGGTLFPYGELSWPARQFDYWPDWSSRGYADSMTALWCRQVSTAGMRGVFLDFADVRITGVSAATGLPVSRPAGFDSAYAANLERFARDLGRDCGIVVANGDAPADGRMWEQFSDPRYTDAAFAAYMRSGSRWDVLKSEAFAPAGSPEWCRVWRFTLAAALMGRGMACVDRPEGPTMLPDEASVRFTLSGARYDSTGAGVEWLKEWLGPGVRLPSGAWRADYPRGLAIWNPTFSPVTVDLGAPLWQELYGRWAPTVNAGRVMRFVTVPARDGRILARRGAR